MEMIGARIFYPLKWIDATAMIDETTQIAALEVIAGIPEKQIRPTPIPTATLPAGSWRYQQPTIRYCKPTPDPFLSEYYIMCNL